MSDALTAGEIVLALAVIALLVGLGAMVYRTRSLSREGNLAVMATRYPNGSWRTGMVRYRPDRLEWFTFRTLRFTPERIWKRGEFVLGSRNTLGSSELPRAMTGDAVSVEIECGAEHFSIA
ncbi:DUF2550 family protein, partial [Dermacoccus barathri]